MSVYIRLEWILGGGKLIIKQYTERMQNHPTLNSKIWNCYLLLIWALKCYSAVSSTCHLQNPTQNCWRGEEEITHVKSETILSYSTIPGILPCMSLSVPLPGPLPFQVQMTKRCIISFVDRNAFPRKVIFFMARVEWNWETPPNLIIISSFASSIQSQCSSG